MKVEYVVTSDCETYPGEARQLPDEDGPGPLDTWGLRSLATDAAQHDFDNCDGWERGDNGYPITVELFLDGVTAGRFEVSMQAVPEFTAAAVVDQPAGETTEARP